MTVHNWDESPLGIWALEVHNEGRYTGEWALRRRHCSAHTSGHVVASCGVGAPGGQPATLVPVCRVG